MTEGGTGGDHRAVIPTPSLRPSYAQPKAGGRDRRIGSAAGSLGSRPAAISRFQMRWKGAAISSVNGFARRGNGGLIFFRGARRHGTDGVDLTQPGRWRRRINFPALQYEHADQNRRLGSGVPGHLVKLGVSRITAGASWTRPPEIARFQMCWKRSGGSSGDGLARRGKDALIFSRRAPARDSWR